MPIIKDCLSLTEFCDRLSDSAYVTVDTEFIREKTYWPQLCLIQLANETEANVIDVMANNLDLTPVLKLMANENVLKVFHAARQDLEIFFKLAKCLPTPIFDTQIAAMVCGFGESVGYETLVNSIIGEPIDKSSRFTDWAARPLTEKQITYALGDVTHLRKIYKTLKSKLSESGRDEWLKEEIKKLTDEEIYLASPREAWRRLKVRNPKPRILAILREIAAWRETEAQKRDLPRNRVLRDDALVEIAHQAPSSVSELARTRGLGKHIAEGVAGRNILKAVETGKNMPEKQQPVLPRRPSLPSGIGPTADLIKVLLKLKSTQKEVAPKLIANASDIEKIAAYGETAEVPALTGWRRQLFGQEALDLRDGKLALIINNQKLELVEFDDD
ncbi:ribonuclease D [Gammaproteobacteria bacterium]|nr:ribonuclease D [Gammaproteobacteria bacterium]